jgi:long-chain acyl-CoA synthetase
MSECTPFSFSLFDNPVTRRNSMNIGDILSHSSKLYGDKVAISSREGQVTYREFESTCRRLGQIFVDLGLNRGDRIAILDFNSLSYSIAHFALPACGLVTLPLNHRLAPLELIEILKDAGASALIYSPAFMDVVEKIRHKVPSLTHFISTEAQGEDQDLPSLMKKRSSESVLTTANYAGLAHLLYTSGTTGKPKGVTISHENTSSTITSLLTEWGLMNEDVGLMVAPLFHIAACHTYMTLIARGCTVHVLPGFDPIETLSAIQKHKVTFTILVPAMIAAIMNVPDQENLDISSLRTIIYAGAPMPEELMKDALVRFGNIFSQIYGTTETSAITCLTKEDHKEAGYLSSAGRQLFGTQVMVVDEHGRETVKGDIGEVIVRGNNVTRGYWNSPEETAKVLKDGWLYTGDMGMQNEKGYIFLKDRKKDMIVTGGENVYPVEVENVLHEISAVKEAAVIGVPHPKWGEMVLALVVLRPYPTITEEDIVEFCRNRLAGYKCPKAVKFSESLPRNPSGKIQKKFLKEKYWAGHERKIH